MILRLLLIFSMPLTGIMAADDNAVKPCLGCKTGKTDFMHRLLKAYADDWKASADTGPEPKFRG